MEEQSRDVWLTKSNIAVADNHGEVVEQKRVARVRVVYAGSGQTRRVAEVSQYELYGSSAYDVCDTSSNTREILSER